MKTINLILSITIFLFSSNLMAQRGYSSGSVSMNRANGIISSDQVVIEEYLNYHTHNITQPKNNEQIALSMEYRYMSNENLVLQVGIATKQILDYSNMPPINISIVIDKSGSMQTGNRLGKVKNALSNLIKGLRPEDYISIITYSDDAKLILQSTKLGDVNNINNIIRSINPGGSTNLNDGLILGYKEVLKNYKPNLTNKVIILTDGIANVGVTETEEIVKNSEFYNKKGIDVSTIGVGSNVNYTLLQQIAKKGKGDNYFVGNAQEDISKAFDDELESLLSSVARNVSVELEYPKGMEIVNVFGYSPKYKKNKITIPLNNINRGLTQVIIYEFKQNKSIKEPIINAKLIYSKASTNKSDKITQEIIIDDDEYNFSNQEVLKNYYIATMAKSLKDMGQFISENKNKEAVEIIDETINQVNTQFPQLKDKDLIRMKNILVSNRQKLNSNNSYSVRETHPFLRIVY